MEAERVAKSLTIYHTTYKDLVAKRLEEEAKAAEEKKAEEEREKAAAAKKAKEDSKGSKKAEKDKEEKAKNGGKNPAAESRKVSMELVKKAIVNLVKHLV